MAEKGELENVEVSRDGDILTLKIDLTKRLRRTGKEENGKSMIIGTTNGFYSLETGEWISLMAGNKE
jgi:hypothetical protein